jgi:hypothetical protein
VGVRDRQDALRDDGPRVEIVGDDVRRGADDLDARSNAWW